MSLWADALNTGLIIAVFAVSLNVLLGQTGVLSVATVGLGAVGGYTAGYVLTAHDWALPAALLAAACSGLVVGTCLALPALRLGDEYLIVLTLAFATVVTALVAAIPDLGGRQGLIGIPPVELGRLLLRPEELLVVTAPLAAAAFLVAWRLTRSPFGRVLRGVREEQSSVEAAGKPVVRFKVLAFAVTSGLAGLSGAMLVQYQLIASPNQFGFAMTTTVVAAVVIGGYGNLLGTLLGAVGLSMIQPALRAVGGLDPVTAAQVQILISGMLLLVVLAARPGGLLSEPGPRPRDRHLLQREVGASTRPPPPGPPSTPVREAGTGVLVARDLTRSFGGIRAVDGLDLELRPGRVTALLGPNGAGKTTVFNLLTGTIPLHAGEIRLDGRRIDAVAPYRRVRLGIARTFQDVRTLDRLSVLDNVRLAIPHQVGERLGPLFLRPVSVAAREAEVTEAALRYLEFVGLEKRALDPAHLLSFGEQKLLAIARLLGTGAQVLLLDEPASGVDRGSLEPIIELIETLRSSGHTICLVEHNIDVVARLADDVCFMEQGRVTATGTMAELMAVDRLSEVYFGHA